MGQPVGAVHSSCTGNDAGWAAEALGLAAAAVRAAIVVRKDFVRNASIGPLDGAATKRAAPLSSSVEDDALPTGERSRRMPSRGGSAERVTGAVAESTGIGKM